MIDKHCGSKKPESTGFPHQPLTNDIQLFDMGDIIKKKKDKKEDLSQGRKKGRMHPENRKKWRKIRSPCVPMVQRKKVNVIIDTY